MSGFRSMSGFIAGFTGVARNVVTMYVSAVKYVYRCDNVSFGQKMELRTGVTAHELSS